MIPINRHPDKDESFVILRGKVRSTTYNDDGSIIESVVLCAEDGVMVWIFPKTCGIDLSRWNPVPSSSNAKKAHLSRTKWRGY